jgi:heme-degrading monooxygenase HmoA
MNAMEESMSVIRLIYTQVPADQADVAIANWKQHCAPLMIKQPGCLSEKLLHSTQEPGEFISYSEWDSEASIQGYLKSRDHQEIKRHNQSIKGASVETKLYTLVQ